MPKVEYKPCSLCGRGDACAPENLCEKCFEIRTKVKQDILREKFNRHGGAREGAGRKPKSKVRKIPVTVTLSPDQVEWLKQQEANASETVRTLIAKAMKNSPAK
jgi:hypothetical protein